MSTFRLTREVVISAAQGLAGLARLIATAAPHSGDFLHAIPCSSVGSDTKLRNSKKLKFKMFLNASRAKTNHLLLCDTLNIQSIQNRVVQVLVDKKLLPHSLYEAN
jgi:hypothetical protein